MTHMVKCAQCGKAIDVDDAEYDSHLDRFFCVMCSDDFDGWDDETGLYIGDYPPKDEDEEYDECL